MTIVHCLKSCNNFCEMLRPLLILLLVSCLSISRTSGIKDEYHEELFMKPLGGYVYSYFQFTTLWDIPFLSVNNSFDHCHLFPRTLGELIQRHNVQELHISLTKGLWRYEDWGYPIQTAPPGAELWAWFKHDTTKIDNKWRELTSALSGLLCASLNFIDSQNSLSPELSLKPSGIEDVYNPLNHTHLRYATLPREIVCTENLTPWKKLLPCNLKRGLSALLNSDNIYNTVYHSLGIHFRPVCSDKECTRVGVELVQTVSLVYDLLIIGRDETHWSIQRQFGQGLGHICPLATTSHIIVDITSNQTGNTFKLIPNTYETIVNSRGGQNTILAVYDLSQQRKDSRYNIEVIYDKVGVISRPKPPIIHANRYITGYGQEFGGIKTKIFNNYRKPIKILFLENIPWFVPIYFHTLNIVSGEKEIVPIVKKYYPGKERVRPYYLELLIELPARSVTSVSIEFDYAFLKWQEYPPDANHGFYMGAASITALLPIARNYSSTPRDKSLLMQSINASRDGYPIRITTEVLIISLPTPDFSMPYNVICLACTVVALAFGPLHNITTKKFVLTSSEKKSFLKKTLTKLISKVKSVFKQKEEESILQSDNPTNDTDCDSSRSDPIQKDKSND
uniref:Secreted Gpi16-like protein n=1 Tax=Pristhesancus plagipennis TaxID=1955184 RepID=A0A2K8JMM0_PRIPG|nr:secreted Gpi16-like protein [Pristhesancus plagipennis]